ncbi:glycoside hydrolase family 39 protein [Collybiopsis luxurians FD-317 M1]|nr:glycoside hydrolase family 39 protein [Collybiopsis luxurians FD-317 M1]
MALDLLVLSGLFASIYARPVNITIDASQVLGNLPPVARFFGADEPNYATYPDGRVLLNHLGSVGPHQTYFRAHNLLTTCDPPDQTTPHRLKWGCTNAYTEDPSNGQPIYNFTIVDEIFDAYMENGVKPYVEIGFMPKALSTHPDPYSFNFTPTSDGNIIFTGWSNPPVSWSKWGELIYQWALHTVDRYGEDEVRSWFWEVWNEPNIPYWNGTEEQYFTLYDYSVNGVLRALPGATVGGPAVAGGAGGDFLGLFLDHTINGTNNATGGRGAPLDFISFHAKGSPTFINATGSVPGHLQMNMASALQNVNDAFSVIQSVQAVNQLPVVISEDDPDSLAAGITPAVEYRNGLIYPSYTVAAFTREIDLANQYDVNFTGATTWAFEYDDHPYFDGFRVLATNQIDKPVLNIFRMFGKLESRRLESQSTGQYPLASVMSGSVRGESDVGVLASISEDGNTIAAMVWNYHDDALPKADAQVSLNISNAFAGQQVANLTHYRIDQSHSNAYAAWQALGSPQDPTPKQQADLEMAGFLQMLHPPTQLKFENGMAGIRFNLPIHAVSLLVIEQ